MDQKTAIEIVRKYIDYLKKNKFDIQQAYLFGSYVVGKHDEDSDIDLAIVMNNSSNSFLTQVELMKISRKFDTRIEPHSFEKSDFNRSNPFANEILRKGIQIA
ncbi:nucleotidyltransferase domain-containing protein [candidate division KSB1 bacterium]|nr:nucleotidyltransferase domain-containing protein [candidate division KSB1 bacterium]NIR68830.1 nucleotidyltransferase domain-containing protein [candidate division KSB1 bacterium]NIS27193.1 nucleotidyltransferase domain-containing protein [candidate division KSB1 bacterium]NIT74078.1 nucleotidyltransferase domain-containing protein [candidate division KSB1 bacterium]NIU27927.1 nucleotidyltransferase domain-containing protein [candidate division KSB1 bacterium]